jgi:hypothetical protein
VRVGRSNPGFGGYHLVAAGDGVVTSIGFFDTSQQADESTRVAATWVRDERLEAALPRSPKITGGKLVVHGVRALSRPSSPKPLRWSEKARTRGPSSRTRTALPSMPLSPVGFSPSGAAARSRRRGAADWGRPWMTAIWRAAAAEWRAARGQMQATA